METERVYQLLQKFQDGVATDAEKAELNDWYRNKFNQQANFPGDEDVIFRNMLDRLTDTIQPKPRLNYRLLAAASILLFLAAALLFKLYYHSPIASNEKAIANDILPGGNKAILTLADGSRVSLTDAGTGQVAVQGKVKLTKSAKDQLLYNTDQQPAASPGTSYNTVETPAGGQYRIVLPDGTKVWLNAQSSIKFPVDFAGLNERRVEVNGEAYFEVIHDKTHPFKVITHDQETTDLGTGFNIKAYHDEKTTLTTLVEGSIAVAGAGHTVTLKPGQQAVLSENLTINNANIREVIAWKKGFFLFEDTPLEDIMQTISRWYDVKVVFTDESLKSETYGAVTTRFTKMSSFFDLIKQTGNADFKIDGRTVTVSRKK